MSRAPYDETIILFAACLRSMYGNAYEHSENVNAIDIGKRRHRNGVYDAQRDAIATIRWRADMPYTAEKVPSARPALGAAAALFSPVRRR